MTYCIFTDLRHFDVKSGNDEMLGRVHDIYLDDQTWAIQWFVVETGHWYSSNKVLLDSKYVTDVSPANRTFDVSIGKDIIENAPSVEEQVVSDANHADRHLRSANELLGYTVSATDGTLGPLTDLVINTSRQTITLMALDTSKWLPDRTVVIVPQSIDRISWQDRELIVTMDKATIEQSPQLQDLKSIETSYVSTLSDYYLYPMV